MKYSKTIIYTIGLFITLTLILTILSYFNIINNPKIPKIIIFLTTFITSGLLTGLSSKKHAYIEGLKISIIYILLFLLLILIIPSLTLSLKTLLYFLLIIVTNIISSTIGINLKKTKN